MFPVGKVDRLNIYPMSFAEFLVANGKASFLEAIDAGDWQSVEALAQEFELLLKNFSTSRDVRSLPLYAFGRWIGRWICN